MNSRHLRAATPLILEAVVTEAEGVSYLHLGPERRGVNFDTRTA